MTSALLDLSLMAYAKESVSSTTGLHHPPGLQGEKVLLVLVFSVLSFNFLDCSPGFYAISKRKRSP